MKDTYKTTHTTKPYTVKAFGYEITIPEGSKVSNKTAMGFCDECHFWEDFRETAEALTGFKNSILAHDLTYYGIDVPGEFCGNY